MTFLPIVGRELRVAARRRGTYWTRFYAALVTIVVSAAICGFMRESPPAELGPALFAPLAVMLFVFCLFAGMWNTADCVSEEKREGTLGLLFLTDLKGYDVVLGKLFANSVNSIYAATAIFPVLGLPLVLGGVAPIAFLLIGLVLANTLLFSLTAGIFVSSISKDTRRATAGTILLILFVVGGLPAIGYFAVEYLWKKPALPDYSLFLLASPGYTFRLAISASTTSKVSPWFWQSLVATNILSWLFLALSCFIVPRCWQDRPQGPAGRSWRERWQSWKYGDATERKNLRAGLLDVNPFLWLAGRDRMKSFLVWAFVVLVAGFWLWGYFESPDMTPDPMVGIFTATILHTGLKIWLASEACRHFVDHRRSGGLELLLSTPLSVGEILRGNLLALQRQFSGPILTVLVADLLLLILGLNKETGDPDRRQITLTFIAGMFMLVLDGYAIAWLGMWFGISARNFNRSWAATLSRILLMPWTVYLGGFLTVVTLRLGSGFNPPTENMLAWWFGISLIIDVFYIAWSKRKLNQEFRTIAAQSNAPERTTRTWWHFRGARSS
jgi:ABC-type transport system involved in cytochrome c biogenesis permease component